MKMNKNSMSKYLVAQVKNIIFWFIVSASILSVPTISFAANASFYLSPETGVYTIGDEFPVAIMLDTDSEMITAVGGSVLFNNKQLQVVSIDSAQSIITSWIF